jgi:Domain of unknown function (DUF4476)
MRCNVNRRSVCVCVLGLVHLVAASAFAHGDERRGRDDRGTPIHRIPSSVCAAQLRGPLKDIAESIAVIDDDIHDASLNRRDRRRAQADVELLQARFALLNDEIMRMCSVDVAPPPPPSVPPPFVPTPMAPRAHQLLLQSLDSASFTDGKLASLDVGVRGQCLTSQQAASVVQKFTFDSDKQKALSRVASQLIADGEELGIVTLWTFDSGQKEAWNVLRSTPRVNACVPQIVSTSVSQEQLAAKGRYIAGAVGDSNRSERLGYVMGDACFTSSQAAVWVSLFSFDSGKQKAIEAMAPHLVNDGEQVTLLNGISSSSNRKAAADALRNTAPLPQCRR